MTRPENLRHVFLEVEVRRDGSVHHQRYENGAPVTKLKVIDAVGKRNTGTRVHFLPDPSYFDTSKVAVGPLKHLLRAKAVLCPGLRVILTIERGGKAETVLDGLRKPPLLSSPSPSRS